jgi:hypothetical protein
MSEDVKNDNNMNVKHNIMCVLLCSHQLPSIVTSALAEEGVLLKNEFFPGNCG